MIQKLKNIYHLGKAVVASFRFGNPSKGMTVIGITGTDGKTTTANLIYHLLTQSGKKAALISTVSARIGDREFDTGFHVSTPDSWVLQSYIKKAKEEGCTHLVLEVTSHGLDQNRAFGIPFAIGVLTNISREHLDYHKTMENYMSAKAKLFKQSKVAILNRDDTSYKFLRAKINKEQSQLVSYGLQEDAEVNPWTFSFTSSLPGEFNRYNCLAAIAVAKQLGLEDSVIRKGIRTFAPTKGRMDVVYDKAFRVIIDFAHTPNAITKLLEALKSERQGRLIHVFGSAGDRDKGKRPAMGKASSEYADVIVLTSEDPRQERLEEITEAIKKGITNDKHILEIADRQEAITTAVQLAEKGDTVVITGKGHEQSMNIKGKEIPWSEYEAVQHALSHRS